MSKHILLPAILTLVSLEVAGCGNNTPFSPITSALPENPTSPTATPSLTSPPANIPSPTPVSSPTRSLNNGSVLFTFDERVRDFTRGTVLLTQGTVSLSQELQINTKQYDGVAQWQEVPAGVWTIEVTLYNFDYPAHTGNDTFTVTAGRMAQVHSRIDYPSGSVAISVDSASASVIQAQGFPAVH